MSWSQWNESWPPPIPPTKFDVCKTVPCFCLQSQFQQNLNSYQMLLLSPRINFPTIFREPNNSDAQATSYFSANSSAKKGGGCLLKSTESTQAYFFLWPKNFLLHKYHNWRTSYIRMYLPPNLCMYLAHTVLTRTCRRNTEKKIISHTLLFYTLKKYYYHRPDRYHAWEPNLT